MEPEITLLSEENQTPKDKYHIASLSMHNLDFFFKYLKVEGDYLEEKQEKVMG